MTNLKLINSNRYQKEAQSLEDDFNWGQDIDPKDVQIFIRWLYAYIAILFVAICVFIHSAVAEDSVDIEQLIISGIQGIERPSMDGPVLPAPKPVDFSNPAYLELVKYSMATALVNRADRENYWGDIDEALGATRRFGPKIPRDFYLNKYLAQWDLEHPTTKARALAVIQSAQPVCPNGFEIYPDSGICNQLPDHITAEQHYYHAKLSVYQLSLRNGELEAKCGYGAPSAKVCIDQGSIRDGSGGFLWKAEGDPKARCAFGTTILLDKKYADITHIDILNSNQEVIFTPDYFGKLSDGRPRFCAFGRLGGTFAPGPIHIKYGENCKTVSNPAVRED